MENKYLLLISLAALLAFSDEAPTTPEPKKVCPEGQEYQECGTACPGTCLNPETKRCMGGCISGCFCLKNTVLHNDECLPLYKCPGYRNGYSSRNPYQSNNEVPTGNSNANRSSNSGRLSKEGKVLKDFADFEWDAPETSSSTTTVLYDDWWFFQSTRKPVNPRDFPGRTGVATWKLISPSQDTGEKLPETAEVTSGAFKTIAVLETIFGLLTATSIYLLTA